LKKKKRGGKAVKERGGAFLWCFNKKNAVEGKGKGTY